MYIYTIYITGLETNGTGKPTSHRLVEMQFWLVGFGLSLGKMASENFRHFISGKKPQFEIESERTELQQQQQQQQQQHYFIIFTIDKIKVHTQPAVSNS